MVIMTLQPIEFTGVEIDASFDVSCIATSNDASISTPVNSMG